MIDLLVVVGAVLTVDDADTELGATAVAIDAGRIVEIGDPAVLRGRHAAREVIERPGSVLLPGWVNTHSHLGMHVFRGLADDVSLEQFLDRLIAAELAVLDEELVEAGARAGIASAVAGGTTSALDMYWYPRATLRAAREAGFRLMTGPSFLGDTDPEGRDFAGVLAEAEALLGEIRAEDPHAPLWVMPHSAYTLGGEQLDAIAALAAAHGARIHTHASESAGELEAVRLRHDARPVAALDRHGLLGAGTVLAHGVHLDADDLARIRRSGSTVAHCPVSNLKLGCGIAPVAELLAGGARVTIGTDGAASGGGLDMFENVRLAALLSSGVHGLPSPVTARTAVRLGTAAGAAALGLDRLGSVQVGHLADLQVVDIDTLHAVPADACSAVVYSATAADVTDVVIGGRVVLRDRELQTIDPVRAREDVRRAAGRLPSSLRPVTDTGKAGADAGPGHGTTPASGGDR